MKLWKLLLLAVPVLASARVHIPDNIPHLFAQSDAVCRGTVLSDTTPNPGALDATGHALPNDYLAVIRVQSCYKGAVAGGELKLSLLQVDPMWGVPLPAGRTFVVFAKSGSQGVYLPTDPGEPAFFWDLPAHTSSAGTGLAMIEDELLQGATSPNEAAALKCAEMLLRFPSLSAQSLGVLRDQPPSANTDLAVMRMVALARSDPGTYIAELVRLVKHRTGPLGYASREIQAILGEQTTAGDFPLLQELIRSGADQILRVNSMLALRRIKDPAFIPFLVEQLDSDDSIVQYEAVITLAEMTGLGGDYGPSMPRFDANPANYRELWKQWWAGQQARQPK